MKYLLLLLVMIIGYASMSTATPLSIFDSDTMATANPEPAVMLFLGFGMIWLADLGRNKIGKK